MKKAVKSQIPISNQILKIGEVVFDNWTFDINENP